ncbi:hypothetical protein PC123_g13995 [Phytophthora cactorum]|nr:hypothetical protein PC123_g13995 [Phytophthora cactorum]
MTAFTQFAIPVATFRQTPALAHPTRPMKCAYADCENLELSITDPCSIYHRPVYHLCSNGLFDPDNIALRAACVTEWKTKNQPAETAVADDQRVTFAIVGWSTEGDASQDAASTTAPFSIQSSEETLPPDTPACVDSYGIPLDIHQFHQPGKRDNEWNVAHILATPYAMGDDGDAERFTHMHILWAATATSEPNHSVDAWESGVRRWIHTSNAKDHIVSKHSKHRHGGEAKRAKRARHQLESAPGYLTQRVNQSASQ